MKARFSPLLLALLSCQSSHTREGQATQHTQPSAAASASTPHPGEVDSAWHKLVAAKLNPESKPYYDGPVGTVRGHVRITGDAPPPHEGVKPVPVGKCFEAHKQSKSLFRVGPQGELADALVAATGYSGQLRPVIEPVHLEVRGCAYAQQTVAMMFGQELLVSNRGPEPVAPHLLGSPTPVMRFAVPGGNPTPVRPQEPGHFVLIDRTNEASSVDVYALAYPTVAVTDLQGAFSIAGVPPGEVTVSALLPMTGDVREQKITVVAGQTVDVDLQLEFNLGRYKALMKSQAASSSAAPAPSGQATPPHPKSH